MRLSVERTLQRLGQLPVEELEEQLELLHIPSNEHVFLEHLGLVLGPLEPQRQPEWLAVVYDQPSC